MKQNIKTTSLNFLYTSTCKAPVHLPTLPNTFAPSRTAFYGWGAGTRGGSDLHKFTRGTHLRANVGWNTVLLNPQVAPW